MTRSSKPGKQRKGAAKAPIHVRRKRVRARLLTNDPTLAGIRSVTVRAGDTVAVLRGDFSHPNSVKSDTRGKRAGQKRGRAGIEGTVIGIDVDSGQILVEGISATKGDGKEEAMPLHASNVVVTKLDEGDPARLARLAARGEGGD